MARITASIAAAAAALLMTAPVASAAMTSCRLKFDLEGWSIFYKYAKGSGRITCSNGQAADVKIVTHGGGPSLGNIKVIEGKGKFSSVTDIKDLYGGYAEADVHAGAGGAATARVMMKSNVNLSIAATGQGINLGIAFGSFRIEPK